jgi:mono/diheme cytochrome c family protein
MSRALSALCLAALLAACGGGEKPAAPPPEASAAPSAPAPVSPPPASAGVPHPDAAAPAGNLRGDAEAGKALYAQYCATCHGASGHGDGPVAATLNPKPANHADHVFMAGLTDQHLYQVISKGGASVGKSPMMAPWGGVIKDQGIKDLIAYLRQLSST